MTRTMMMRLYEVPSDFLCPIRLFAVLVYFTGAPFFLRRAYLIPLPLADRRKGTGMKTVILNQFDPLTTSFRELKAMVGRTAGQKLPSAKTLRESADEILFSFERGDVTLTVFASGYFIYECCGKETVSAVDRCQEIIYEYQDGEIRKVEESDFRDGPCLIPLLVKGEDRVVENMDRYERYWHEFSLSNDGEDWATEASAQSAEDYFIREEDALQIRDGLEKLTKRQRQIVQLYYVDGLSQYEIADLLHLKRTSVQSVLEAGMRRLKNVF